MTSSEYRTSNLFLRNEFDCVGQWGFSLIKKQNLDLNNLDLISFSDISKNDTLNTNKGVHFFVDDYRFVSIYEKPERSLERLRKYAFLLTPDYSLYGEMRPWRQIESVGKSRWIGAYWQNHGCSVIPTVSWGTPSSFRFCFDGIEHGSIVAVGMIGCKQNRQGFMRGYNTMLETIEPEAVICFGSPFPEMEGNLLIVDYLSTRRVIRHGR